MRAGDSLIRAILLRASPPRERKFVFKEVPPDPTSASKLSGMVTRARAAASPRPTPEPARRGEKQNNKGAPGEPVFAPADVQLHNRPEDCWLVIHGGVYDVTKWCAYCRIRSLGGPAAQGVAGGQYFTGNF